MLLGSKGQGGKHKGDRPVRRMLQLVLLALLLTLLIGGGIYLYHSNNEGPRKSNKRAAPADSTGGTQHDITKELVNPNAKNAKKNSDIEETIENSSKESNEQKESLLKLGNEPTDSSHKDER